MSQLKPTQIWNMRLNEYLRYWSLKALKSVSVTLYKLPMVLQNCHRNRHLGMYWRMSWGGLMVESTEVTIVAQNSYEVSSSTIFYGLTRLYYLEKWFAMRRYCYFTDDSSFRLQPNAALLNCHSCLMSFFMGSKSLRMTTQLNQICIRHFSSVNAS